MKLVSLARVFVGSLIGLAVLIFTGAGIVAISVHDSQARARDLAKSAMFRPMKLPDEAPLLGQESIKLALEAFGIQVPKNVRGPFYSASLEDRGLTLRKGAMSDAIVYIGPDAFSSWPLLGSTLAHEIEVHCRQNFLAIHFQNLAGFDGTGAAEREAYRYELVSSERFGLSHYERELIESTMSYFYPEQKNRFAANFSPIRLWIDQLAAAGLGRDLF